jgi:hypothetical protein
MEKHDKVIRVCIMSQLTIMFKTINDVKEFLPRTSRLVRIKDDLYWIVSEKGTVGTAEIIDKPEEDKNVRNVGDIGTASETGDEGRGAGKCIFGVCNSRGKI